MTEGPTSFAGVQSSLYWSSSFREDDPGDAWLVTLLYGFVFDNIMVNDVFVWPVRGGH